MKSENGTLQEEDWYMSEEGLMVFTSTYHRKRGYCCGSGCRHCPFNYDRVDPARRKLLPRPVPYDKKATENMNHSGEIK